MKKLVQTMAAVTTAIIFLSIQQLNAQTWNQAGNVVTAASKLGSTNLAPVIFVSNNIERIRLDSIGRLGIGTAIPSARLHVAGTVKIVDGTQGNGRILTSDVFGLARWATPTFWSLTGNAATDPTINFAGTTDSAAFVIRTRNIERMRVTALGGVGIGTTNPTAKLGVVGDAAAGANVIQVTTSYLGTSHIRGILSLSKPADGYGYGIQSTGGLLGGYFIGDGGASAGTVYGSFNSASGSAGTRIGVYGTAFGGTVNNWGGYFPTKTYTNELRVGGTTGATGYVAAINGRLIATEVRVDLIAAWPDYVFSKDHNLLPIDALEAKINADKHLPGVPSAATMQQTGIMLGEMQIKAMEKIEENTLYIIQLNNKIKELEKKIEALTQKAN